MDVFEALYTTRAMRRVAPDPVPSEVAASMLDAAIRAPSGGNAQNWRFVLVTDPETRGSLGPVYRQAWSQLERTIYQGRREKAEAAGDDATLRLIRSSQWLADNFEQVPMWLFAFHRNDPTGASVYPALWNAMLAARAHGVGTCLTTILGTFEHDYVVELLDVPVERGWRLAAAVSCGYPLGRWDVPRRIPVERVSFSNRWGEPLTFEVNGPLWPG